MELSTTAVKGGAQLLKPPVNGPVKNTLPPTAHHALYGRDDIAERMKSFETLTEQTVPPTSPFVIRLDGVSFRTYTKGMKAPFDERMSIAMVETTKDLVEKMNPVLGYCQSDEISLVFPAVMSPESNTDESQSQSETPLSTTESSTSSNKNQDKSTAPTKKKQKIIEKCHPYSGRVQKLSSTAASLASARFNFHMANMNWDDLSPSTQSKMKNHEAYFDGRVVICPDNNTIAECIFWRSNVDGLRNSISGIAQAYFKPKDLHKKGGVEKFKMLGEIGVDIFNTYPIRFMFGTWVKREQYFKYGCVDFRTKEVLDTPVTRTRIRCGSFNWADWNADARTKFVFDKYWDGGPPKDPVNEDAPDEKKLEDEELRY
ncbi:hypothetical protein HK098_000745 [Nowakowskiella sp. JEL0407]|nr:hypothetical protein HK098_000745 [Nowakowskiella sp. JEL0407]